MAEQGASNGLRPAVGSSRRRLAAWAVLLAGGVLAGRATVLGTGSPFALAVLTNMAGQGFSPRDLLVYSAAALMSLSEWGRHWSSPQFLSLTIAVLLVFSARRAARNRAGGPIWVAAVASTLAGAIALLSHGFSALWSLSGWASVGLQAALTGTIAAVLQRGVLAAKSGNRSPDLTLAWLLVVFTAVAGATGLRIWHLSLETLLGSLVVLLAGWKGGVPVGATSGLFVGVAQMLSAPGGVVPELAALSSLSLAVAGMAAGLFRELGRIPSTCGFLLAFGLMTFIPGRVLPVVPGLWEALLLGAVLFVTLPSRWLHLGYGTLFGGPRSDRCGDSPPPAELRMTAAVMTIRRRILAVARLLKEAAHPLPFDQTAGETAATGAADAPDGFAPTAGQVVEGVCRQCVRYSQCWETDFFTTYSVLSELWDRYCNETASVDRNPPGLTAFCPRTPEVVQVLLTERDRLKLDQAFREQLQAARRTMAGQFHSVARLLEQMADDLDPERVAAPASPMVEIIAGHALLPKKGNIVAGDSVHMGPVGTDLYMIALCDGMGSGRAAATDSQRAVGMLRSLLEAGFSVAAALHTINAALLLYSHTERFVTVDLAILELSSGHMQTAKLGAAPTVIVRKGESIQVTGDAPPAGILPVVACADGTYKLLPGDWVIWATDGFWTARGDENPDWVAHIVNGTSDQTPRQVADILLAQAIACNPTEPTDDMTVVALRVHPVQGARGGLSGAGDAAGTPKPIPVRRAPVDRSLVIRRSPR